ncbi:major capsid protein [Microbacterium phage Franklin22]|uniref:major capsid protein n=1 Tax=Microbacterium phage Franklin22 TaxID=2894293 RepID=UPI001E8177C1|nr:major capsid protein [Microbacterium phage Franklin22]UGL61818.1 major capsid protein [Microbacterium phage Franklin22]
MDPKAELAALQAKLSAIVAGVKASGRDLTDAEITDIEAGNARAIELKALIERGEKSAALMASIAGMSVEVEDVKDAGDKPVAKTLGEHFVKSGAQAEFLKGQGQRTASAPEFKAATDTNLAGDNGKVQYGGVVDTALRRLTIADLLGKGTMSNTSLTYWVQGVVEGAPTAVAEEGEKPQIHFNFAPVTEALSKIAVITKISDEAIADTDYLVSVINSQLVGRLMVVEEDQLLNGNGTAPNLRGLLNRVGIQTYATSATYSAEKGFDGIFHAITLVSTGTAQATADGIVINPADYEVLRLAKDGEGRYLAGGPFSGGNPGLWGVRTVVTPAIAAGTVLVGAFGTEAQLFRKGGVQVDSTNSNEDDFKFNRIALRAEERILLAVYRPAAFVKVTLTA